MSTMMELADKGVMRMRLDNWAFPTDYIRVTVHGELLGPWIYLFSVMNKETNGRNPVAMFAGGDKGDEWLEYTGELSPDDEVAA